MDESCDFSWIYNVSNGVMVIWLFRQFRWSSCNKLALFSDLSEPSPLGRCLSRRFLFAWRGRDVKHTFMGGLLAGHGRPARPLPQEEHMQQQQGECQHSGPGRSGEVRKEPKAYHLRTHRQSCRSTPTTPCPTTKS